MNIINESRTLKGGFQCSVTVYSVAKKGRLTRFASSNACTYEGDRPSKEINVDAHLPLLVIIERHGNGSWDSFYVTTTAAKRLESCGLTPSMAFDRFVDEFAARVAAQ